MPHSAPADLVWLQRDFLAFMTASGERSQPPRALLAEVDARAPGDALAVYRNMYTLRMAREVAREYPATCALLGRDAFAALARAYQAAHDSRSFSLDGYGAALPGFLRRTRARRDAAALALLERALAEVRASGAPQLLSFDFDVELGYARFARGAPIRRLRARRTCVALFSRSGGAARLRVAARELAFLRALLRGAGLERAVAVACASGLGPAAIRRALERWVGGGLLRACYRSGSVSIQAAPWSASFAQRAEGERRPAG